MPSLTDEQWAVADGIDGWYFRAEADLLWRLCDGLWCEVGCWRGKSTVVLAQSGYKGYAIDWFKGSPEHQGKPPNTLEDFKRYVAPFPNVTILDYRFEDCADQVPDGLRLLHLDADHSYAATRAAWELYAHKVEVSGHVVLHDAWSPSGGRRIEGAPWPGTCQFALEMEQHPEWELVESVERCAAFRRI